MSEANTVSPLPLPLHPLPIHHLEGSFMYALMKAIEKDQNTMSEMQIINADSTMIAAKIESNLYGYWNAVLKKDADEVEYYTTGKGSKEKDASKKAQKWQQQYNVDSAKAQSEESQQDGAVQGAQGQTSADASNLQMKAQMVQGVNSILTTLVNLLGRVTA